MRCLIDENMSPRVAAALTSLGHPSEQAARFGLQGEVDLRVFDTGIRFDLIITQDLHRQYEEWHGARERMQIGLKILRLKFEHSERNDAVAQMRYILWHWAAIERRLAPDGDAVQATISAGGTMIRFNTAQEMLEMPGPQTGRDT